MVYAGTQAVQASVPAFTQQTTCSWGTGQRYTVCPSHKAKGKRRQHELLLRHLVAVAVAVVLFRGGRRQPLAAILYVYTVDVLLSFVKDKIIASSVMGLLL